MIRKKQILLVLILVFGCTFVGVAQNKTVTGTVTDAQTGDPLVGVNILVKGTSIGTTTDKNGAYNLTVPSLQDTLRFSYIGYQTKTVSINGRTSIDVALQTKVISGQQLVVIGYGKQKKSNLTGAITTVQPQDFNKGVNTSVAQVLQGKVAGVRIVQSGGAPGGGVSVSIRGASSVNAGTGPLYVIDGMPIQNAEAVTGTGRGFNHRAGGNPLNSINPDNIASIEVLKDAAATAIYGARGANGVIIITTKQGKGGQTRVNYSASIGLQTPEKQLDILTPEQYKRVKNAIIAAGGGGAANKIGKLINGGTNWQSEIFKERALVQNHNLSVSGGNDKTTYYIGLGYMGENGIVKTSFYKRYNGHLSLTSDVSKKFHVGINLSVAYSKNNYAPAESFGNNENNGAVYDAINWDPTKPVFDEDGNYYHDPHLLMDNPVVSLHGRNSIKNSYRYFGTAHGTYDLLPHLQVKFKVGADVTNQRRDTYINRLTQIGKSSGGIATILHGRLSNYLITGTATYHKSFGQNNIKILAGISEQNFSTDRSRSSATGFSSDATATNNIGLGTQATYRIGSSKFGHKLLSYISRINYRFRNTYLLTAAFRIDGSSKFGQNNKYGYFPSFSFGWKLKQEKFFQNVNFVSRLKLRASWGQTGNDNIRNYISLTTFAPGAHADWDGQPVVGISPARLANPNIQWETTSQFDIGLDFGFLNNRISGSMDYYQKRTFDMLLNVPVPRSTGFLIQTRNVGSIKNKGIEIALTTDNIRNINFLWETNINLSTLSNKVTGLGGIPKIIGGGASFTKQIFITKVGLPLRSYYGYKIIGVWQKGDDFSKTKDNVHPGNLRYKDMTGDGHVKGEDRVPLGDSFPNYTFSIGNTFSYKDISLNIFITGVQGISMLNNNLVDTYFPVQFRRNAFAKPYLNRWTPENPSHKYPSFVHPLSQGKKGVNSYTVEDASYVKLKSLQLSYSFPKKILGNTIRSGQISFTIENVYTWTKYLGFDPAVSASGNANALIDFNTYPLPRTYTLGIQLGF